MAGLANLLDKAVYLDTNIFVYVIEGYEPEQALLHALLVALEEKRFVAVTSELTLAELLVRPFELGREDVVSAYTDLVTPSDRLAVLPVDRAILIEAARQRATLGMRMPDAIHVATALAASCEVFLNNDQQAQAAPPALSRELLWE